MSKAMEKDDGLSELQLANAEKTGQIFGGTSEICGSSKNVKRTDGNSKLSLKGESTQHIVEKFRTEIKQAARGVHGNTSSASISVSPGKDEKREFSGRQKGLMGAAEETEGDEKSTCKVETDGGLRKRPRSIKLEKAVTSNIPSSKKTCISMDSSASLSKRSRPPELAAATDDMPSLKKTSITVDSSDLKAALDRYMPHIVSRMDLVSLTPHLISNGLLTQNERELLLNSNHTEYERKLKLCNIIHRKSSEGYQKFLKAFSEEPEHLGHGEIVEILTDPSKAALQTETMVSEMESFSSEPETEHSFHHTEGKRLRLPESYEDAASYIPFSKMACIPSATGDYSSSDDSNTKHSENSQEDYEPRFMDNPDEHDCRVLLNRCQPNFVTYLDLPSLIPHLNAHLLLTCQQDEFLRNERHTRHDRILKLLEYINGKGPNGYKNFLQALREERTHMGHKELNKCLTKTEPRFLSPRDTLIERLKEVYSSSEWYKNASGSNPTNLEYIRLALIKKAKLSQNASERSTCRFLKDSLLGNVDDIEHRKESLKDVKEIFDYGKGSQRKKVLVEGKPGIGKTMLALHISAEWAKGQMLQEYDCILFVPLRRFQRKVQTSKHIPEYQLQRELDTIDLVKVYLGGELGFQASEELNRSGGERTLLILEGWDELPPELREEGSFFFRIISGQLFPKASVLVTSRPTVSSDLYDFMSERRIEVIGFSKKQIRQYIERNIPSKKEMVIQHLQKFPNVERLAHIPMTLCTICNLVTAGYMESLPSTLTELYDTYVRDILYNGLKKQLNPEFQHIKGISELHKLPGESQQVLDSLAKLALQGLQKRKFVFEADDLIAVGLQPEGTFDAYGLLSTFPCYVGAGYDLFYQFRHLTIQEFLAAKGIEKLDHSQQMSLLDEYRLQKEFRVVWKFLSGITKLEDDELRDAIVFKTRRRNNQDQLFLLHCVYEAHDPQLCSTTAGYLEHKLSLDNCTLNSTDCLCAAYIVAQSGGDWELNLRGCHMGGDGLETLRWHLVEHQNPNAPPIKLLNLNIMSNSLHLHPAESSEPLEPPEPYGMDVLATVIIGHIPVIEITVNSTSFGDDGVAILAEALCHNTTIQDVSIATCGITASGAKHLANMLLTNTTVKSLFLRWNKLGDDGVKHLASVLKRNCTLTELSIGDNDIGPAGLSHLCEMLKVNGTLEILRIEKSQLGPGECRLLSGMFPYNKTLQLIDMTKIPIGDDGLHIIVEGLKVSPNTGIRKLGLFGCGITDRGVEKICELISKTSLEVIQLGSNHGITDFGAQCLARALECNTSVKILRLEDTNITERGKTNLYQVSKSREDLYIGYKRNSHLWKKPEDNHLWSEHYSLNY